MSAASVSEFDFVKLLITLDTAVAGALIYGQEHLLRVQASRWLLAVSVGLFVISIIACMSAIRALVTIDMVFSNYERMRADNVQLPAEQRRLHEQAFPRFKVAFAIAALCFILGILLAFVFFLWNLTGIRLI